MDAWKILSFPFLEVFKLAVAFKEGHAMPSTRLTDRGKVQTLELVRPTGSHGNAVQLLLRLEGMDPFWMQLGHEWIRVRYTPEI